MRALRTAFGKSYVALVLTLRRIEYRVFLSLFVRAHLFLRVSTALYDRVEEILRQIIQKSKKSL
jgi:hypothetical protein